MLECVINISEGRDQDRLGQIAEVARPALLDVQSDPHHNRSVLTVIGEEAARSVATATVTALDLRCHEGVHPRLGVLDVVPFVALAGSTASDACRARDRFATWLSDAHGVPCFLYGRERTLPDVRRDAFRSLAPATGPGAPHPTAGATAVGCRDVLVAYNVWLDGVDLATARRIATMVRGPGIRALGLQVGERVQLSMNLIQPAVVTPADAYDAVRSGAAAVGGSVVGAELVGLVPLAVLDRVPQGRWPELDLSAERSIEARIEALR